MGNGIGLELMVYEKGNETRAQKAFRCSVWLYTRSLMSTGAARLGPGCTS